MKNYFSTFNKHPHHNFNNIFKTFLTVSNIFFKHALLYFARQVFIRYQSLELIRARARKKEKKGPTVPGTKCEEPIVFVEIFILILFIWRRRIFEGLIVLENPRVVGTHLRSGENCKVSQ